MPSRNADNSRAPLPFDSGRRSQGGVLTESDCRMLSRVVDFSERERQILVLLSHKKTYPEIASDLDISRSTVQAHASSLQHQFGVRNRLELVLEALRLLAGLRGTT